MLKHGGIQEGNGSTQDGTGCADFVVFSVAGTPMLSSLLECSSNKEHGGRNDKLGRSVTFTPSTKNMNAFERDIDIFSPCFRCRDYNHSLLSFLYTFVVAPDRNGLMKICSISICRADEGSST